MSELWNKIPTGASGWILFFIALFISPLVIAFVRDRISKPVATWLGKTALLLVTLGFRSGRDRLFRDVGQRRIEPAVITIYLLVALAACGFLGQSIGEYQRLDTIGDVQNSQSLDHMTTEQLVKERDATKREIARLKWEKAVLGTGLGAFFLVYFFIGGIRFKVVSDFVRLFEHQLAKSLPHLSFQDERVVRAEFANIASYADYVRVMDALVVLRNPVEENLGGAETGDLPTDPTNPA